MLDAYVGSDVNWVRKAGGYDDTIVAYGRLFLVRKLDWWECSVRYPPGLRVTTVVLYWMVVQSS